ncbi:MAG: 2-hydroxyacyl-CoA dehydratase [Desulfobacteraceae bacterium]|nr:2-hydroxyacyl-CoA dehydratase [Desulfobacteraceae bacterium]MBC2756824.1 2-hydroxyacyl-CoA dehydratase [Desulfobacteraceae bacterium]
MRPEIKEYNYDWLMGHAVAAAAKVPAGMQKETELTLRYIPNFRGVAESFINAGPPGIQFMGLLAKYYENILAARDQGKMIVGTTFCNTPAILYAMDIVPATFEVLTAIGCLIWKRGMFDYMDYCCEVGMPETSCSSQRGFLGAYLAGLCEKIDFVICDTPGVCDTNANAFAFASAYLDKPFFQLNYPSSIGDDRSQTYHIDDYKAMIRFIEKQCGKKLDYDRLAEILKEIDKQDALTADMEDMLMLVPTPIPPIFNVIIYASRFCFAGHKIYTEILETMVETSKQRVAAGVPGSASGEEKLRAFMCYIDHYTVDMNFYDYLEERGVAHTGSILTRNFRDDNKYVQDLEGSSYGIDTSTPDAMLDSIAQMNARYPMVRSIRGPYDKHGMWLEESLALAKMYNADCILYNGTPGCRNTWGMIKPFARDMEKYGYPTHIMNDDAFDDRVESWDATKERLDEFFHVRGLL